MCKFWCNRKSKQKQLVFKSHGHVSSRNCFFLLHQQPWCECCWCHFHFECFVFAEIMIQQKSKCRENSWERASKRVLRQSLALLVQSVELSADSRLKVLIHSDWSRLSESQRSSRSICVEEGQTSTRRRSTHCEYIWMFVWISRQRTHSEALPSFHPFFKLITNVLSQSFHYIFMTFTPC